ncbi:hypothetical protein ACE41H_05655 [Paenibacillus enshidis]|uniref:DUF4183 domain-containing protein n=1 Tax=Paenibacillus enshidis TaxID=1458439 RepID=A0ABV5APX5_9BACL
MTTTVINNYNTTIMAPMTNGVNMPMPMAGEQQSVTTVSLDLSNPLAIKGTIRVESLSGDPEVLVRFGG